MLVKGQLGMRRGEWALCLGALVYGGCIAWLHLGAITKKLGIMEYRSSMCCTRGVAIACGFEDSWSSCIAKE